VILLDSSILVASIAIGHVHHDYAKDHVPHYQQKLIYDHSLLEAFRVLTFPNLDRGGFAMPPEICVWALQQMLTDATLIGLSSDDRLRGLANFAAQNVISARIYDAMIGYAGISHGARRIITLNGKNFRSLFPALEIIEPA
jgi:hypothetical protein